MAPFTVAHLCQERSLAALMLNQLRTARTIKLIDPLGYAGSIHRTPDSVRGSRCASRRPRCSIPALSFPRGCLTVCLAAERVFSIPRQSYWLPLFYDALFIVVYVASFFGAHVTWRGERFRLAADGSLVQDAK